MAEQRTQVQHLSTSCLMVLFTKLATAEMDADMTNVVQIPCPLTTVVSKDMLTSRHADLNLVEQCVKEDGANA